MTLVIDIAVKFRFMGMTLGTVRRHFQFPVPQAAMLFAEQIQSKLKMDDRGVKITSKLEAE